MFRSEVRKDKLHLLDDCCQRLVEREDSIFVECLHCESLYIKAELKGDV